MRQIGSGPCYRVEFDTPKNRVYLTFFGDAVSPASVTGLEEAVQTACGLSKPGFTTLSDFIEMKLLGLPDVVKNVQNIVFNAGVRKVASVWSYESFAKIIVDSSAEKVKAGEYSEKRKVFHDRLEAEAWLNE